MNEETEPFGGCDILEPEGDNKEEVGLYNGERIIKSEQEEGHFTVRTVIPQQTVRLIKNTQLYREVKGLSKTVTIDEGNNGRRIGHPSLSQPSSSTSQWQQDNNESRGSGQRKLTKLTLRIGKKEMTFKVTDIPPQSNEYTNEWDLPSRFNHTEASILYSKKQCVQCNRMFNTMEEIRRHIADAHSFRAFACPYCPQSYSTRGEIMAHARSHSVDRPHECPMCSKRFRHQSNLNQHLRLHASGKHFFCNMCGKCFKTTDDLAHHHSRCLATTEGDGNSSGGGSSGNERPARYKCGYCSKPFHFRRDKVIHERVHTGERPYECGYCGRAFTQSQALTSHIRLHTGEKPYQCQICQKNFRDSSALRKHESQHIDVPNGIVSNAHMRVPTMIVQDRSLNRERESMIQEDDEDNIDHNNYTDGGKHHPVHLMSQLEMDGADLEEEVEEVEEEIPMDGHYYM